MEYGRDCMPKPDPTTTFMMSRVHLIWTFKTQDFDYVEPEQDPISIFVYGVFKNDNLHDLAQTSGMVEPVAYLGEQSSQVPNPKASLL